MLVSTPPKMPKTSQVLIRLPLQLSHIHFSHVQFLPTRHQALCHPQPRLGRMPPLGSSLKGADPIRFIHTLGEPPQRRETGFRSPPLSGMTFDTLREQLSVTPGGFLVRQGNYADKIAWSIAQGGD